MLESKIYIKEETIEEEYCIVSTSSKACKSELGKAEVLTSSAGASRAPPAHYLPKRYRYSELYPDEVQDRPADPTEDPLHVLTDPQFDVPYDDCNFQQQVITGVKRQHKQAATGIQLPQVPQQCRLDLSSCKMKPLGDPTVCGLPGDSAAHLPPVQSQTFHWHEESRLQQSKCNLQVVPTSTSHVASSDRQQYVSAINHNVSQSQCVSAKFGPGVNTHSKSKPKAGGSDNNEQGVVTSSVLTSKSNFLQRIDELLKQNEEVVHCYTAPASLLAVTTNVKQVRKQKPALKPPPPRPIPHVDHQPKPNPHIDHLPKPSSYVEYVDLQPKTKPKPKAKHKHKPKPQKQAPKFKCIYCKIPFDTKKEMDDHIATSLKPCMKFPCLICKTYFCNFVKFNEHMVDAHKTCKVCNEKFKSKYEYTLHENDHKAGVILVYHCAICLNEYKSKNLLQDHIIESHPGKSIHEYQQAKKDLPLGCSVLLPNQCVYCDALFTSNKDLEQHLRSHNIGLGTR